MQQMYINSVVKGQIMQKSLKAPKRWQPNVHIEIAYCNTQSRIEATNKNKWGGITCTDKVQTWDLVGFLYLESRALRARR